MRAAVIGRHGQIARALGEQAALVGAEILTLARPDIDLMHTDSVLAALAGVRADIVINAAAYTSVDLAETETEAAYAINAAGAAAIAEAARTLNMPIIHLSTDYVFDGKLGRAYGEDHPTCPINQYGQSKLCGEKAVASANPDHAILRTGWVYSPFGKNFLRTMLAIATTQSEVSVVADQVGAPTSAFDVADGVLRVARNMLSNPKNVGMRGTFHITAAGEATWAQFAEAIFVASAVAGGPSARVRRIATSDYPTPARRPADSRLDSAKIAHVHHVIIRQWRDALPTSIGRLIPSEFKANSRNRK